LRRSSSLPAYSCAALPTSEGVPIVSLLHLRLCLAPFRPVQSVFCRAARHLVVTHTKIIRGVAATVGKRRIALNRYPDAPSMGIE
jgi:hypothetical protein